MVLSSGSFTLLIISRWPLSMTCKILASIYAICGQTLIWGVLLSPQGSQVNDPPPRNPRSLLISDKWQRSLDL